MRGQTALLPSAPNTNPAPTPPKSSSQLMPRPAAAKASRPGVGAQHDERDDDLQAKAPRHRLAVDRGAVGRPAERDRQQDEEPRQRLDFGRSWRRRRCPPRWPRHPAARQGRRNPPDARERGQEPELVHESQAGSITNEDGGPRTEDGGRSEEGGLRNTSQPTHVLSSPRRRSSGPTSLLGPPSLPRRSVLPSLRPPSFSSLLRPRPGTCVAPGGRHVEHAE